MTSVETTLTPSGDRGELTTPGKMIERAREHAKLSQADLAQRLRLDTRYIRHLELDNFEQLPGPTFVKGYIRSIANELNVNPDPILESYREISNTEREPTLADFESRPPPQVSSNSFTVKAGSYALVIVSVLLFVFWWQSNKQESSKGSVSEQPTAHTNTPLPYDFTQVIHDESPYFESPLKRLEDSMTAIERENGDKSDVGTLERGEASNSERFELSLSTSAESWVEIYDEDGKQLYFGMANLRAPIIVKSEKPLDLLIGNTPTVELKINEQTIDLESLSRDGVAKFTYP
ncbi:MAG: RodZ domain-containing protein [Pseudomonadota bacterium]